MNRANEILTTYIGDMIALERHILESADRQANDTTVRSYAQAILLVEKLKRLAQAHATLLESHLKTLGGAPISSSVKEAFTTVAGIAHGVIDRMRTHAVSKDLRDDYAALNLAAVSYEMLHTTALALGDFGTANLARQYLEDYTPVIVKISEIIPYIVVNELVGETPTVDTSIAGQAAQNVHQAWSHQVIARAA